MTFFRIRVGLLTLFVTTAVVSGCAANRLQAPVGTSVENPQAFAAELRSATLPESPEQYTFAWTLNEQGSEVGGRGVVRTEAGERIRLDLFGRRGETYLIAALVNGEYRLPPAAENAETLPSPSIFWAGLGILNPPPEATLVTGTESDDSAELRYETRDGQTFAYTFRRLGDGDFRLVRLERAGNRGIIETVAVERDESGRITRTHYRDWSAFRDLALDVEAVRTSAAFPSDIWRPDAASR